MTETPIRVLLVDDQALIRRGLETLLKRKRDIVVVGHATNGREAIAQVAALDPDVVLMDIRMPELDGVEATTRLVQSRARAGIIILTTFQDDEYVFNALAAGARGYLLKDVDPQELVEAIRRVAQGEALIQPTITRQVLEEFRRMRSGGAAPETKPAMPSMNSLITEREYEILKLLAQGHTNQEISKQLSVSVGTVKNHVSSILGKLGARDRMQAMLLAKQFGLI